MATEAFHDSVVRMFTSREGSWTRKKEYPTL
jgi:hypothetical protein